MNPIFFYVLALIAAVLALEGLGAIIKGHRLRTRATVQRRLKKLTDRIHAPDVDDHESILRVTDQRSIRERIAERIPGRKQIELSLYRAGLTISPERFLLVCGALAALGFFLGLTFFAHFGQALLCTSIGFLPIMNVRRLQRRRRNQFEKQFPDSLDLLIRALRAGHSLSSGFAMVGEELPDPVGTEFANTADQIRLGKSMQAALGNLTYRVDSEDLPFFVTAVAIQQETGSNLAEVLENLASVMRERFKIFGKVRAITAMGRGSANLLAAWPLFAVAGLYMVNPSYISPLWEVPAGHRLAMISVAMVAIGYALCRKFATIRV
jgi:tight adherence protein B